MIIVGGTFEVEPGQQEAFIASHVELMKISRAEKGCIDYAFLADPIERDRVTLFERWETAEDLTAHLAAMQAAGPTSAPRMAPKAAQVTFYDATERSRPGS